MRTTVGRMILSIRVEKEVLNGGPETVSVGHAKKNRSILGRGAHPPQLSSQFQLHASAHGFQHLQSQIFQRPPSSTFKHPQPSIQRRLPRSCGSSAQLKRAPKPAQGIRAAASKAAIRASPVADRGVPAPFPPARPPARLCFQWSSNRCLPRSCGSKSSSSRACPATSASRAPARSRAPCPAARPLRAA